MFAYAVDRLFLKKISSKKLATQPPLVALHGWGRDHSSLLAIAELLSENRDIYLFDLPGFGQSPAPIFEKEIPSAKDIAHWLLLRLKNESLTNFDLLGHSFGGKVAFYMTLESNSISRLILMASSGVQAKKTLKKRLWLYLLKWSAKALKSIDWLLGLDLFSTWFRPKFGSKDYLAAGAMRPILVKSVQEELWPLLQKLQTPTLLLWGEKDTETPLEIAIRMEKVLSNASLISLPFSGHLLMEENPSLCAYFIEKFLLRETACY